MPPAYSNPLEGTWRKPRDFLELIGKMRHTAVIELIGNFR